MSEAPRFGTAGLSDSYRVRSFDPQAMAEYTASFGLTAFEYQCGRGVRLGLDKAAALKEAFDAKGITFSVHAPYYISMSSLEEDKRLNSVNYLLQSCALVKALGGRRVIFHAGSCGKQSREAALEKALDTMRRAVQAVDEAGYGDCILCPETMGKVNQLGTLDEVLALCGVDERIIPCVDFGHLYARSQGTELNDETAPADYAAILDAIAAALPGERAKKFHAHFSRIAYTKGGEKCHLTFADTEFGPPPAPLMQLLNVDITTEYGAYLANVAFFSLNFICVALIFRRFLFDSFAPLKERRLGWFFLAVGIGYGICVISSNLLTLVYTLLDVLPDNLNNETVGAMLTEHAGTMLLFTCIFAPITEECLFRGVLFTPFCKKCPWVGYVLSVLLFAL